MGTEMWVQVSTEELDRLTGGTDASLAELEDARTSILVALDQLDSDPAGNLATAAVLRSELESALAQCESLIGALGTRSAALREATRGYDGAEAGVLARLSATFLASAGGPPPGLLPGPGMLGMAIANWLSGRPALPSAMASAQTSQLIAPLAMLISRLGLSRPQDPVGSALQEITLRDPEVSQQAPAASSPADLAARIEGAVAASGPDDTAVEVQRIEHEDGTVSWVVAVPGTMGGFPPPGTSGVPMSWDSNASDYLGMTSAADALVVAAMARAGIAPGEKVLIAGYSLGGMVVTNLANDPAVRERFDIAAVVTFGSPVAHLPAPPVPALNVQHVEDGLAGLSGQIGARDGGPAPGEVVVVRELGSAAGAGFDSHGIEVYRETAEQLTDSEHPGLAGWEEATQDLWAGENDTVTATTYRGSRADG